MTSNNGGPAFPHGALPSGKTPDGLEWKDVPPQGGMSLRDWFAGMALQGILSNAWIAERFGAAEATRAKDAYAFADAMLEERNKP
jgi:hypothetical protein